MNIIQSIQEQLQPGEIYAGIILGEQNYHLILLPDKPKRNLTWDESKHWWAKSVSGELPNRQEQLLLFTNLRNEHSQEFQKSWYWCSDEYINNNYAWSNNFYQIDQFQQNKSCELLARAVRRININ